MSNFVLGKFYFSKRLPFILHFLIILLYVLILNYLIWVESECFLLLSATLINHLTLFMLTSNQNIKRVSPIGHHCLILKLRFKIIFHFTRYHIRSLSRSLVLILLLMLTYHLHDLLKLLELLCKLTFTSFWLLFEIRSINFSPLSLRWTNFTYLTCLETKLFKLFSCVSFLFVVLRKNILAVIIFLY